MKIVHSEIFNDKPKISFGLSTRVTPSEEDQFGFNLSFYINDAGKRVAENRCKFFAELGLSEESVAYHHQVHGDRIQYVDKGGFTGESDALITDKPGLGLAITTADCTAIFIYDKQNEIIAAVHSGWRGTSKRVLLKTLNKLSNEYNSKPNDLIVFVSPSISQKNYEVSNNVAEQFDEKYLNRVNGKIYLDVASANLDMMLNYGIPKKQIEKSDLCSYESVFLHSYRRDGERSGRALGIIAMKAKQ